MPSRAALGVFGILLLKVRGIEQHEPRQFARRRGRDDLAAETGLYEQRNASAVIEMRMREE